MHKLSRKTVAVVAGAVLLVSGAGAAFAYWTTTGSGTGTATTGTNVAITVNQTAVTGLYPGQAAVTLSGTFNNPNQGPAYVTAVTATGFTIDSTHVGAGCLPASYTLGGTAVVTGNDVAPGSPAVGSSWTGLTITMNNLATSQDACKGATVTISYSSS